MDEPKSLYDRTFRYTKAAEQIDSETNAVLRNVFTKWVEQGYSPREISHIMNSVVVELELTTILGWMDTEKKDADK